MKLNYHEMIKEKTFVVLILSLFPTLALTFNFELAYTIGLIVFLLLMISNIFVSLFKKLIPENIIFPVQIILNGTIVTVIGMFLKDYIPALYSALGIYLPLLAINPVLFDRASYARENKVYKSILDALKTGLLYFFLLATIGLIREVSGANTITIFGHLSAITGEKLIYRVFTATEFFPVSFFTSPAGAFLILGLIIACVERFKKGRV